MRKFLSLLLALLMLPLPGALAAEKYETLPEHMQMTQSFEHERLGNNVSIDRAWPVTANESVNAELRAAIDQLETQGRAFLPARATRDKEGALLDVGATVYRTGESWASFLMTASVQDDRKQIYTAVDTRAYDLLTGKAITLSDVIADEAGWQIVADAVRAQASAISRRARGRSAPGRADAGSCKRALYPDGGLSAIALPRRSPVRRQANADARARALHCPGRAPDQRSPAPNR